MIGDVIGAWLDVRTKPLRTLAAIAGMVAAVVAVVLVDAAGVLSHEANEIYLARTYGRPITASIFSESGKVAHADSERLERALVDNGIKALSPAWQIPATVTYDGSTILSGMRVISPEYADIHIVNVVAGAWPEDTAESSVLHAVVTEGWAGDVLAMSDREIVGQQLGYVITVDGQFNSKTTPVQPIVIDAVVSTDTSAFGSGVGPLSIVTSADNPDLERSVVGMSWLARVNPTDYGFLQHLVRSVTDEAGRPIYSVSRTDQGNQLAPVLDQQDVTADIVTIVALTIGGLGILGVGIAGVRERAQEFGLRRALGASKARIFAGVIVQTLMEVLLSALIAIPLAALLVEAFARDMVLETLPMPPSASLPLSSAMLGLVGALIVGMLAGLIPAVNAARASVVEALRG